MIKKFIFATLIALVTASCGNVKVKAEFANDSAPKVKPGIEVLRDGGFEQLKGKRVGLITNPSGVDNNLKSTICWYGCT